MTVGKNRHWQVPETGPRSHAWGPTGKEASWSGGTSRHQAKKVESNGRSHEVQPYDSGESSACPLSRRHSQELLDSMCKGMTVLKRRLQRVRPRSRGRLEECNNPSKRWWWPGQGRATAVVKKLTEESLAFPAFLSHSHSSGPGLHHLTPNYCNSSFLSSLDLLPLFISAFIPAQRVVGP